MDTFCVCIVSAYMQSNWNYGFNVNLCEFLSNSVIIIEAKKMTTVRGADIPTIIHKN